MRGLGSNSDGNTFVYVTLVFGVVLGAMGIALDLDRPFIPNSEGQVAAIAAAGRVDESGTAITRAQNAVNKPFNHEQTDFRRDGLAEYRGHRLFGVLDRAAGDTVPLEITG